MDEREISEEIRKSDLLDKITQLTEEVERLKGNRSGRYASLLKENEGFRNRIAELEKEIKEMKDRKFLGNWEDQELLHISDVKKIADDAKAEGRREMIEKIEKFPNPYPKDVFTWNNKEKLGFNRGKFNEFTHKQIENFRDDVIQILNRRGIGERKGVSQSDSTPFGSKRREGIE